MKILVISNLFPPHYLGGYEITCGQVCRELERRGHRVVVLTSTHGLKPGATDGRPGDVRRVLQLYLPFGRPAKLMRTRRWWVGRENYRTTVDLVLRERPDVIFVWSLLRLTLGPAYAAQDSGVPVAYSLNDESIAGYLPARFRLAPRAFSRYVADRVLPDITLRGLTLRSATCISRLLKTNLTARGVPVEDARVIYHGIPLKDFPAKPEPGEVRTPARVLYVGQLHPYKGVHTLIEAAQMVSSSNGMPAPRVSVVGDGPDAYRSQLHEKAAQGGARVDFVGKVAHAELARIYREHDIFVFPSTWQEPFGLTHLEAMASGTPVISTTGGGHGEFLRDGENALVFEKEDAGQLAGHILRLIRDGDLSRRLAMRARAVVEREFSLERYVEDLEAFLQETAGDETRQIRRGLAV
ncbi:glycosyltransferase family 4 protein [bacterium]|nr:glycosyltransferase family 4 protein [bacterium]